MLQGSLVAIVTPMLEDGSLDFQRLKALVDWHVASGTAAIAVVGTTGESPTVDVEEHQALIKAAVEHAAGRVPVIAGTGANSTREAIDLARYAKAVGADYHLSVVPYYNKPTQEGIYRHFRAIAEAADIPMVLYNVPGRTVADVQADTVLRLAGIPNIVGIKEATGNIDRALQILRKAPRDFSVYSGDDFTALALMLVGGKGNVSVTANVAPRLMHDMCMAAVAGRAREATDMHMRMMDLNTLLMCEPNPTAVKWALAAMGRIEGGIRLPLVPLSSRHDELRAALAALGIPVLH